MSAIVVHTSEILSQGAEAKLYNGMFAERPMIIKERFVKTYRHPSLDKSLTTHRIKAEVRCMLRCRMNGIRTPVVYGVDMQTGRILMEYVTNSQTVKDCIKSAQASSNDDSSNDWLIKLANRIGSILATMHHKNIIHGDLTTSNLLLVGAPADLSLCLLDFGLGSLEGTAEDKAVDLYVLERALLSTHPSTEFVFTEIIRCYTEQYRACASSKVVDEVIAKLEEVRLRGRKRTMVG